MGRFPLVLVLLLLGALLSGLGPSDPAAPSIRFTDVTADAGIDFRHDNGGSGRRYVVEIAGGGVLVLDYDGDGWPDLFFVNGAPLPGRSDPPRPGALYRNRGDGTFVDATAAAGLAVTGYGMGGGAADVDNDGDADLLVTAFGANRFFRNNGDGTFTETTASMGIADPRWSTSAAFADFDADGYLDLYVCNYLAFTVATHKPCYSPTKNIPAYCHPREYDGVDDAVYRNEAGLGFVDATAAAGLVRGGKGLGVATADYDDDGDVDVYVANDTTRNFLYRNEGGRLVEVGEASGVAYNEQGLPEAGMGVDWGDVDGDGRLDLVVTNFDFETNTLYKNLGGGLFFDATTTLGLGDRSLVELGFGCDLEDFDNDGRLDLVVTNGHILDNVEQIQSNLRFAQPGQFFWNGPAGRFVEISGAVGPALARPRVGRGLATLDLDGDGDRDLVLASNGGPAELLRNDGGAARPSVRLRLVGTASNRDGVGARVELVVGGGRRLVRELRTGSSYLSQNELAVDLGLGDAAAAEAVRVRWPSGRVDELARLAGRRAYVVKEGVGVVGSTALAAGAER